MEEEAATRVELHDARDIVGTGSLNFPTFHMFDTNWRLKMKIRRSDNSLALKLCHERTEPDDLWELEAMIRVKMDEPWQVDASFDWTFSQHRKGVQLEDVGVWKEQKRGTDDAVEVNVFMQVHRCSGIQLRNFIDFSRPFPIFSDAIVLADGQKFHVNRMILSMASPVFLQRFIGSEKQEIEVPEVKNARDFQRILNLIYPPHLAPKQWIKQTHCKDQQLADIRRILDIAKLLKISIILEKTDEFVLKFGNLELGAAILLAQNYGLRKLMGSKIASIQTIRQISTLAEFSSFSKKTKGLILDHILSRATKTI